MTSEERERFEEHWNALTVEINKVGIPKATEILRQATLASNSGAEAVQ